MKSSLLYITLVLLICSCSLYKTYDIETPFVSVVKLIDAEQAYDLEKAKQYIDVVKVYTKLGSINPEEDWEKQMRFNYNLGKDKKFTNVFGFRNYNIAEMVNGNAANVCFKSKEDGASIKQITYGLEKRNKKWIVVSIDYIK